MNTPGMGLHKPAAYGYPSRCDMSHFCSGMKAPMHGQRVLDSINRNCDWHLLQMSVKHEHQALPEGLQPLAVPGTTLCLYVTQLLLSGQTEHEDPVHAMTNAGQVVQSDRGLREQPCEYCLLLQATTAFHPHEESESLVAVVHEELDQI